MLRFVSDRDRLQRNVQKMYELPVGGLPCQIVSCALSLVIVDDDPHVRNVLERYLRSEGYKVNSVPSAASFRDDVSLADTALVFVDLGLPDENGLELVREIRSRTNVPVIIITGKNDPLERVIGLEIGADDYIAKPFELREVLARVRAVLRRTAAMRKTLDTGDVAQGGLSEGGASPGLQSGTMAGSPRFTFDNMVLDTLKRELRDGDGEIVSLTSGEFDLLCVFAECPNRVLTREQLLDRAHGRGWSAFDRSIDTQIARLRKKIENKPSAPKLIKTVRGAGYIFTAEVSRVE